MKRRAVCTAIDAIKLGGVLMSITGSLLIGSVARRGKNGKFRGVDAASGADLEGTSGGATKTDLEYAAYLYRRRRDRFTEVRSQPPRAGVSTSVGSLAIDRFMRPVCYQHLPAAPPPDAPKDSNPLKISRVEKAIAALERHRPYVRIASGAPIK